MASSLFNPLQQASHDNPTESTWSFNDAPIIGAVPSLCDAEHSDVRSQCSLDSSDTPREGDSSSSPTFDPSSLFDTSLGLADTFSRSSTPQSDFNDDGSEAQYARSTRLARASATKAFVNIGCWLDHDESGNYDPATEGISVPTSRRKRPLDQVVPSVVKNVKRIKARSTRTARQQGIGCEVIFKLPQSLECRLLALDMPHNWPSDKSWNIFIDEPPIRETSDTDTAYHTRSRRQSGKAKKYDIQDDFTVDDDLDDLTGHPLARGCKRCRKLGERCSLLEPGTKYPCDACTEDNADCELNVEPVRKQTCERCIRRRRHCSYNDSGSDHSRECADCSREGFKCFAGPAQNPGRTRMTADGKPATPLLAKQKKRIDAIAPVAEDTPARSGSGRYLKCTECQSTGRRCSLNKRKPELPCKYCKEHNTKCMLEQPIALNSVPPTRPPPASSGTLSSSPGLVFVRKDKSLACQPIDTKPVVTQIITKLVHPVKFMYNAMPSNPCTFCHSPLLAIIGYSQRTPTVSIWANGRGCTEMKGGHAAAGKPRTQLCGGCTLSRLLICACPGHVLGRIDGQKDRDVQSIDKSKGSDELREKQTRLVKTTVPATTQALRKAENAALKQLTLTPPSSATRTASLARWCSLCPALATYTCTTSPFICTDKLKPEFRHSLPQAAGAYNKAGCGLKLCDSCMAVFKVQRQDLGMTVNMMKDAIRMKGAEANWPRGLRADYELLRTDGFLIRQAEGDFRH